MTTITLDSSELEQYSRHITLPGFGLEKQRKLKQARVLLVGAGGLGCPAGLYLAAAGVGTLGVVDFDPVERSNLQRQIAHSVDTVGLPKVDSLIASMRGINPLLNYQPHHARLDEHNVSAIIAQYDLVLDGSDNFATRYLLADACYLGKVPLLQGAVHEYQGQMTLFVPDAGPCYRCLFEESPSRNALAPCAEVGVLGVVPGIVGVMMATEAIKFLTGSGQTLQGQLLIYQALDQSLRKIAIERNEDCPLCGKKPTIRHVQMTETPIVCNHQPTNDFQLSRNDAEQRISHGAILLDVRESFEYDAGHLPGAIHLPLGQLNEASANHLLDKSHSILVYCQKGMRSLEAVNHLRQYGFAQAFSMAGGLSEWRVPAG